MPLSGSGEWMCIKIVAERVFYSKSKVFHNIKELRRFLNISKYIKKHLILSKL
jgi:hypothetical protein